MDFLQAHGLIKPGDRVWEPACGKGKMQKVIASRGYQVVGTDLNPQIEGMDSIDFLTSEMDCDWIITNPPFSKATEFINHAIELGKPCAFLLKSQFWHAKSRVDLFWKKRPTHVLPLTWRPDFLFGDKSGSPTMEVAWSIWGGQEGDITEYVPLEKPNY